MARSETEVRGSQSRLGRPVLLFLVVAIAHGCGTALAYTVNRVTSDGVSLFPAAGVTVAVLLLVPRRRWPVVLGATMFAELAGNLLIGEVIGTAVGSALSNVVEPFVGAWLVVRFVGGAPALDRRRPLFIFLGGACVAAPAIGAILGAASTQLTPGHQHYLSVLGRWFTGDALGVLVVGSLILAWMTPPSDATRSDAGAAEALVVGGAVIVFTVAPFFTWSPALAYLALPPLVWVALRFGVRGATLGGATVAFIADWATLRGNGVFAVLAGDRHDVALWQLQVFLGVLLTAALVIASHVAELGHAEKALRVSEEQNRFGSLLESSPDPILLFREDSTVVYANELLLTLTNLDGDELLGRPFVELFSEEVRHEMLAVMRSVINRPPGSRWFFDMDQLGDVLTGSFEAAISPIDTVDGRMLLATLRDITERKEANEALREALVVSEKATRAKADFLATMSHEIRTPMSAVSSLIDLMDHTDVDDEQRSLLSTMKDSSRALLRIIDDTLDVSKIEAGMLEIESVPFSVADEVFAIASLLEPTATAKGITLECRADSSLPRTLLGDPLRVRQVLVNLVGNALKFTQSGGVELEASGREHDEPNMVFVVFTVRDTGVGMDEDQQAAVFRPFTQAEHATTRLYGGTGLGLSIVSHLVEMMSGEIGLESTPGVGSTFTVQLPLEALPDEPSLTAPATEAPVLAEARRFGGHVVLVAEDNEVNRDVLRRQLALIGCACEVAGDGRAALERYHAGGISLLFTDCHMPAMDGFELTRIIRADEVASQRAQRLPVIAVTAKAMHGEGERCFAAGMDAYLTKPVGIRQLAETLGKLLPPDPIVGPEAIDLTALREIVGDDEEALAEVLATYATSMRSLLVELEECAMSGDRKPLVSVAHRIAGAAVSVGANRLATLARTAELGAAGEPAALNGTVEWIGVEAASVERQIALIGAVHG